MRKVLLVLSLMGIYGISFAQTAVTAPSAPTIPAMIIVSPNAVAALTASTTNRIFIDQSGDNPNVNMTQEGSGNKAGSVASPVYLRGIDQTLVTRQIGNNNEISLELVNDSTGANKGVNVTVQQLGNSNTLDAACGRGTSSTGETALTNCNNFNANWKFNGNNNSFQYRGTGSDQTSSFDILGNSNVFNLDVIGDKHTQTIKVVGDTNTFNINQRSTGNTGSSVWIDLAGNNNTFNVSQTGTLNHVVNVKTVTNNGVFNITQTN